MKKTSSLNNISNFVIEGMQEKKAIDIIILDLHKIPNIFTNFMLICTAKSNTHIEAITESVIDEVAKKNGNKPYGVEGLKSKEWILIDYIDIVVHIFLTEKRKRYSLETYWGDAIIKRIDNNN